ncbi:MAG: YchJ family protein [Simkaniaceae bacterium]
MKYCPCGSKKPYPYCCQPYHTGTKLPLTPLDLMRSRYSAYALNIPSYIIETTHPDSPLFQNDPKKWKNDILLFSLTTAFQKLEILDFIPGDEEAFVTFIAHIMQSGEDATFTEKSRFLKEEGRWYYHSGKIKNGIAAKEDFS